MKQDTTLTPVYFGTEGEVDPVAFFCEFDSSNGIGDLDTYGHIICYTHNGQHSGAAQDYMKHCADATPEQYAPLLKELEEQGYKPYAVSCEQLQKFIKCEQMPPMAFDSDETDNLSSRFFRMDFPKLPITSAQFNEQDLWDAWGTWMEAGFHFCALVECMDGCIPSELEYSIGMGDPCEEEEGFYVELDEMKAATPAVRREFLLYIDQVLDALKELELDY